MDYQTTRYERPIASNKHRSYRLSKQYEWSLTTALSPPVDKLYNFAKKQLTTALETKFAEFPTAIVDTHGKDLQISAAPSAEPSRTGTPAPSASSSASKANATSAPKVVKREEKPLNTSRVSTEANFMVSAEDLYSILTDENRIPSWTRAPAQVSTTREVIETK